MTPREELDSLRRLAELEAKAKPSTPVAPTEDQKLRASGPMRYVQGVRDVIDSGTQLMMHSLPEGLVGAVNRGVEKVNNLPVIGPATVALGMTPASRQDVDRGISESERLLQEARKATSQDPGIDWARMGGNIATVAPMAAAVPTGATLPAEMGLGAASGGAFGLAQPVTNNQQNFWTEKGKQAAIGAGLGAVAAPIGEAASRVINPRVRPEVRLLMNEGVTPTPGQILGGRAQVLEDKATSIPILGDAIASSQRRGIEEMNRAAYARALQGTGGQVPRQVGREGVEAVRDQLGAAYDNLLPQMRFQADPQFNASMAQLRGMAQGLPRRESREFDNIIQREITDRLTPQGMGMGTTLKEIEGQIGKESRRFTASTDAYQRSLGDALLQVQSNFRDAVRRSNPQFADELQAINTGYANYARLRDAASRQGSNNGIVTPGQLAAAVRAADKSAGKGNYATGNAYMQDLSDAAKNVLAPTYPNSGTAGRAMLGLGAAGGAAAVNPAILMGGAAGITPYVPGGRELAAALLASRPQGAQQLADTVRQFLPPAVIATTPAMTPN